MSTPVVHHVLKIWYGVIIGVILIVVLVVVFVYKFRKMKKNSITFYDELEMREINRGAESPL